MVRQPKSGLIGSAGPPCLIFCTHIGTPIRRVSGMTEKIPISGIKISPTLTAVRLRTAPASQDLTARLCRLLTIARVNIAFMTCAGKADGSYALCCIDPDQRDKVARLVDQDAELKAAASFGGELGLLTLYPHRASLKMLGMALQVLNESGIRIHGLASSISALTFVIDFGRLEDAAATLSGRVALPRNPAPLRADFQVRQEKLAR
jgi:aspartokinase